jgi:hypothetical protein
LFSQTTLTAEQFILNSNQSNQNYIYKARDYVSYKPGYSYKPQTNNEKITQSNTKLDFKNQPQGSYIVKININDKTKKYTIIKQ